MSTRETIRFRFDRRSSLSPTTQIHDQLVAFVHLGLLPSGAPLPSVRDLAAQTGLNMKTAFRIYRSLAREDMVKIRPQRGVFVKFTARTARRSYQSALGGFLRRVLREAKQHSLSPRRFAQLLASEAGVAGERPIRCAVLECNREQTHLFSEELTRELRVDAFPVLTNSSRERRERALRRADVFITTDFHWEEAKRWAARHHKELYPIRLNPAFLRALVRNARRGLFPMVLTDISFEPRFRRAVAASVPAEVLNRMVFVHYRDRSRLRQLLARSRRAYVSPLCYREAAKQAPRGVKLITLRNMVSRESLRALRRSLVLPSAPSNRQF